jgi:GNAT superfamily N-acetyltransferase
VSAGGGRAAAVVIRPVRPGDAEALAEMFGRCSDETRYHRFHGVVRELPPAYLRRCLDPGPDAHTAFVAEVAAGGARRLVGLASAGPVAGASHVLETGVLVEDALQRQGIGRRLLAALSAHARASGVGLLRLEMCRSRPALLAYVFAHAQVAAATRDGCDVTIDVSVDAMSDVVSDVVSEVPSDVPVDVVSDVPVDMAADMALGMARDMAVGMARDAASDVAVAVTGGPGRAAQGA